MKTFSSNFQALNEAQRLSNKTVQYSNEGLEINLTKSESVECEDIVSKLNNSFSDIVVTGRIYKTIKINSISKKKHGLKIISITY